MSKHSTKNSKKNQKQQAQFLPEQQLSDSRNGQFPCATCGDRFEQSKIWNGKCTTCLQKLVYPNKNDDEDIKIKTHSQEYLASTYAEFKHAEQGGGISAQHAGHLTIIVFALIFAGLAYVMV